MVPKENIGRGAYIVVYTDGMARPKAGTIGVRVEEELLQRIDAVVRMMSTPYLEPSRSDVVRACLLAGLPAVEAHAKRLAAAGKVTEKAAAKPTAKVLKGKARK